MFGGRKGFELELEVSVNGDRHMGVWRSFVDCGLDLHKTESVPLDE